MSQIYKDPGSSPAPDIETITGDSGGPVGPDAVFNINLPGNPDINVVGNPATNTIQLTDLVKITPYVVSNIVGQTRFNTIQSAINAANAAGGGMIYVWPGTYTENLTFFDKIQLVSVEYIDVYQTTIIGVHTPPLAGGMAIRGIRLSSATDIFNSAAAGTARIAILECSFAVADGYVFNMPNWTAAGSFNINNCGSQGSVQDGVLNNSGGSPIFTNNCQIGAGTTRTFTANGDVRLDLTFLDCPSNISGGNMFINFALFPKTVTFTGNAHGNLFLGDFFTGATPAIVMNSTGNINLFNVYISSTHNPAITGAGTGILSIANTTFVNNTKIASTITTSDSNSGYYNTFEISETGSVQTIGAAVANLFTLDLGAVPANYSFNVLITGFDTTTPSAATYGIIGGIRTTGVAAVSNGVPDYTDCEDAAMLPADDDLLAVGNTAVVRVTGIAGRTINWKARINYIRTV